MLPPLGGLQPSLALGWGLGTRPLKRARGRLVCTKSSGILEGYPIPSLFLKSLTDGLQPTVHTESVKLLCFLWVTWSKSGERIYSQASVGNKQEERKAGSLGKESYPKLRSAASAEWGSRNLGQSLINVSGSADPPQFFLSRKSFELNESCFLAILSFKWLCKPWLI